METQISPEIDAKINAVLEQMNTVWRNAYRYVSQDDFGRLQQMYSVGKIGQKFIERNAPKGMTQMPTEYPGDRAIPMTRELFAVLYGDIYRANEQSDVSNHELNFHMSVADMIKYHAPHKFLGCTGTAKLFCHFARQIGLECKVIETSSLHRKESGYVDGHQIIGVQFDGKMVAFDPAQQPPFQKLKDTTEIKISNQIQSIEKDGFSKYTITAFFDRDEFESAVTQYSDLENDWTRQGAKINDVLDTMHSVLNKSDKFVEESDFNKLKDLYNRFPDKKFAARMWERNGLPPDFKFVAHKFPMTEELCAWLHPEYCTAHGIDSINPAPDFHFHLTADDIIQLRICPRVAACIGHAKLFCHFARQHDLDCNVIATAKPAPQDKVILNGHQIIGVEIDGKMVAFDPAHKTFRPLQNQPDIRPGNEIQSVEQDGEPKYRISAIIPRDEIESVMASYADYDKIQRPFIKTKTECFKSAIHNIRANNQPNIMQIISNQNE